ncbi:MAG: DedA family protein [Arenimonas sp.]
MKIFQPLYDKAIKWAQHKNAVVILITLSFFEAFIFPVMPEVMLAPMCLAKPKMGFRYATLSLVASLFGALIGYALGHYAYEFIRPLLSPELQQGIGTWVESLRLDMQQHWLTMLGILMVAAIQPVIPMKVVTWAAGIVGVPILLFLACIAVGRGKRLFLVAVAIRLGGPKAEAALRKYIEPIGWFAMLLLIGFVAWIMMKPEGT